MARILFETPEGEKSISTMDISFDETTSAWSVDLGEGGSANISNVGSNIQKLVIPEQRVYRIELTESEEV